VPFDDDVGTTYTTNRDIIPLYFIRRRYGSSNGNSGNGSNSGGIEIDRLRRGLRRINRTASMSTSHKSPFIKTTRFATSEGARARMPTTFRSKYPTPIDTAVDKLNRCTSCGQFVPVTYTVVVQSDNESGFDVIEDTCSRRCAEIHMSTAMIADMFF
jgi:hypothetical protein